MLRALTSGPAAVDGVASVAYAFEAAGADPRLDGYPIGAELRAETARATFSTDGARRGWTRRCCAWRARRHPRSRDP
ncbi:MAG TPA: hypothetical protein VKY66_06240 [Protaetiibacter sp.]|nr:hypothetical protein [Protaetiibacter sp.]